MTLPNFFIIGAARSGTTSLYNYLSAHPDVYMSPEKEPSYFSPDVNGKSFVPKKFIYARNYIKTRVIDFIKYQTLFEEAGNATAVGEASVSYLYSGEAPRLIREKIPQAKLVVSLRDPVERGFSSFRLKANNRNEIYERYEKAVKAEKKRIRKGFFFGYHYVHYGLYYQHLKPFYDCFGKDAIHVILYEDIKRDIKKVLFGLYDFLGVDPSFCPESFPVLSRGISREIPEHLKTPQRFGPFGIFHRMPVVETEVNPRLRERLKAFYREDILALQSLISRDLSAWL